MTSQEEDPYKIVWESKNEQESEPEAESGDSDDEEASDMDTTPDSKENGKKKNKKKPKKKVETKKKPKKPRAKKGEKKEDPPKKPKTANQFFQLVFRRDRADELKGVEFGDQSKKISKIWNNLGADAKVPFQDMVMEDKKRYAAAMAQWEKDFPEAAARVAAEAQRKAASKGGKAPKRGPAKKQTPALEFAPLVTKVCRDLQPASVDIDTARPNV